MGKGVVGNHSHTGTNHSQPQERNTNSKRTVNAMDTSNDVPQPQRLL